MCRAIDRVRSEFTKQAPDFNAYIAGQSKALFNRSAAAQLHLTGTERILEVAAGTCAFGRTLAPLAGWITELDATSAMLDAGRAENEKAGIRNADYVTAAAESLPFADGSFDAAVCRLAFHHFTSPEPVFSEMRRVVRPGGQLVIADMLARDEPLRAAADRYETLRDPSHVRCLSADEFLALAERFGMETAHRSVTDIPVKLDDWMALTRVPSALRAEIAAAMRADMEGSEKTGFSPFQDGGGIAFVQHWGLFIFRNPSAD